jgi:oligopeptide transport system substrate-binding protein
MALLAGAVVLGGGLGATLAQDRGEVRILVGAPVSLDPARQGDANSAAIGTQLFETVTAFDAGLTLRPALAASWDVTDDGRQVVFHLRPGLTFSDGSPLTADDVAASWLRLLDPAAPSPLAALLHDVRNARPRLLGQADEAEVGIRADGADVVVDLERPGADFPAIAAAPIFGVVPPGVRRGDELAGAPGAVVSGGYGVAAVSDGEITLEANARYWAGPPAIGTVRLLLDIGGRSPVAAFEAGDIDYTSLSAFDASWIRYDERLGPQLREEPSLSLVYLAFDTTRPPFDDPRVRQAVGAAVDWRRLTELGAFGGEQPARSMVPPGIPGAGDADWRPAHDPDAARRLLADAGHAAGAGLPEIHFAVDGWDYAEAIAAELETELGLRIRLEAVDDHFTRLATDPPEMFFVGWQADYPGPNDFLGVLLGSDAGDNYGGWVSGEFDAALADALATRDATAAQAAYERALAIVRDEVPAVPLVTRAGWALSRDGLLGAAPNPLGMLRMAGLAWAP